MALHAQSRSLTAAQLEAERQNNVGIAYMNQQLPARALERFRAAEKVLNGAAIPQLNEGIALLYLGKLPEAQQALRSAAEKDPKNPRPSYCLGLLNMLSGDAADAKASFAAAEALDPEDADVHYYLASAEFNLKEYAAAEVEYQAALRLNPLHASAEFGLARVLQHSGAMADARTHLNRFQQLTNSKVGTTVSAQYNEQGRLAVAQEMPLPVPVVEPMIPVRYVPREVEGAERSGDGKQSGAGVCLLDLDGSGRKTILSVGSGAEVLHAFRFSGHALTEISLKESGLSASGDGVSCAVGDFDNDGLPDVALALSDRIVLFRNLGHGHFADVTEKAGIHALNRPSGLTFVDFDHDGDLDLFITGRPSQPGGTTNVLWRNNGNSTFTEWTKEPALTGNGQTQSAAVSDINNDRAIDFVITGDQTAPSVYLNQREGAFLHRPLYSGNSIPATRGVVVADFNKDGWMDVALTHDGAPGLTLWRNTNGNDFTRIPIKLADVRGGWGLTTVDFDNDGWLDIAALVDTDAGTRLKVFRNTGPGGFQDVSAALGVSDLHIDGARSLVAADLDDRGVADLVIGRVQKSPLILENIGGERNHSLRLRLAGMADNKSAIGAKVEVFAEGLWQKFEVTGSEGFESQGDLELRAGLGSHAKVDIIRVLWPTGVPQDELDIPTDKLLALTELDRRGSSCPVLFAWDGSKFQFVSDVIGAAVIGHWISPTARNANDSDEWIKIDGHLLRSSDGLLHVRFGEPMEEINYIDQIRLLAVDHPANVEAYPDERFLSEPPFPDGGLVLASPMIHNVAGAWDNNGRDVHAELSAKDHVYVRGFHNLSYAGFAEPHTLTLDLGPWRADHPLRLFLHGYIEYFSASSMYAAWQAGIVPEPPSVEAEMPDGTWRRIIDDMGFPAGLPRTIVVDLTGRIPAEVRRIRLRTNLQIYWDQIRVDNGPAVSAGREVDVPLRTAQLVFRGYPKQIEGRTPGDLTYDYDRISATGPFQWQRGTYTHYGDVKPLLGARDDRYVIFGSGEEIDADFDPSGLPALPPHWTRDYFFYADGFVKDMDFYEALPFTVDKLPFHAMSTYPYERPESYPDSNDKVKYQLEWNDRFESGTRLQRFDFNYDAPVSKPDARAVSAEGTR